jgi:FkbM family methyltransferase
MKFRKSIGRSRFNRQWDSIEKLYIALRGNIEHMIWNGTKFVFSVHSHHERMRIRHCKDKEPDTNRWIDTFINENDVFYDVGANMGIFSLYAAKRRKCKVYAFEPLYHNFFTLNKNIVLNKLDDKILAYNISLHDMLDVNKIYLNGLESGDAAATFKTGKKDAKYIQGSIGFSVDELTKYLPFPNHIKIDVDGNESFILKGMKTTLKDKRLRSVLVEINQNREYIEDLLTKSGFKLYWSGKGDNHIFVKD